MRLERAKLVRKTRYYEQPVWDALEKLADFYQVSESELLRDYLRDKVTEEELKVQNLKHARMGEMRKKAELQRGENRHNPHVFG